VLIKLSILLYITISIDFHNTSWWPSSKLLDDLVDEWESPWMSCDAEATKWRRRSGVWFDF